MFFILSTGRSGTQTIARTFSLLYDCTCPHEPAPELIIESSAYRYGDFSHSELKEILLKTRNPRNGKIYGESNQTLSLIIPVLVDAFPIAQFIWQIRNGLDVVASTVGRQWYTGHTVNHDCYDDCSPIQKLWIDGRIMGDRCGDVPKKHWGEMGPFARCCWYWSYVNRIIEQDLQKYAPDRYRILRLEQIDTDLLKLTKWLGLRAIVIARAGTYNRAHYSPYHWTNWTDAERKMFSYWCGPLMDRLYPKWKDESGQWNDIPYQKKSGIVNHLPVHSRFYQKLNYLLAKRW